MPFGVLKSLALEDILQKRVKKDRFLTKTKPQKPEKNLKIQNLLHGHLHTFLGFWPKSAFQVRKKVQKNAIFDPKSRKMIKVTPSKRSKMIK